ncbi:MAG: hypothetical protein AAFW97_04025 [Pseudomonadota bacterium]
MANRGALANDSTGSGQPGGSPDPGRIRPRGAAFLKTYLQARREREWQFPKGLFSDPAWDILLELYVAESEDRPIYESAVGPAISIPEKSGLRWLGILEARQLISRALEDEHGQEARISLTPNAIAGMNHWLDRMAPSQPGDSERG